MEKSLFTQQLQRFIALFAAVSLAKTAIWGNWPNTTFDVIFSSLLIGAGAALAIAFIVSLANYVRN